MLLEHLATEDYNLYLLKLIRLIHFVHSRNF